MKIVIATIKNWNIEKAQEIQKKYIRAHEVYIITKKDEVCLEVLNSIKPDYIFFPHWSFFIPENVFLKYNCIVFHMTDLPYGRGGSPLQNLIVRGKSETKISAIKVVKKLDAGPVYYKEDLSLEGSAEEIFRRASNIIFEKMIPKIIENDIQLTEQKGEIVEFKRRKPEESKIEPDFSVRQIYNYIRMLDAEGYPSAFIEYGDYILDFSKAELLDDDTVKANVIFRRKSNEQNSCCSSTSR